MTRSLVACLSMFVAAFTAVAAAAAETRPNLLLVLSDDHSAPFVGCYGNAAVKTPNLDRFAGEGFRLARAYTAAPQCVPSRAAIMTGRSAVAVRMTRFSAPLDRSEVTYPELLRASGYYVGVCGRMYHLDGAKRLNEVTADVFRRHDLKTFEDRLDFVRTANGGDQSVAQMEEFLAGKPKDKPFFLQLCFSDPHRGFDRDASSDPLDPAALSLPPYFPDLPSLRADLAQYCDEIERVDRDFARVLAVLDRQGVADDTLVMFMGDNGGALLRGKGTLNDLGTHVPLIARWNGVVTRGGVSQSLISGEDLAPTFLEAAGVPPDPRMTGKSFLPLLTGRAYEPRQYVFSERGAHGSGLPTNSSAFDLGRSVTSDTHRLIYNALWQVPYWPVDFSGQPFWKEMQALHAAGKLGEPFERLYFSPTRPMFELYDLTNDPYELNNLAGKNEAAQVERQLKAALQEWMIVERDYVPLPIP